MHVWLVLLVLLLAVTTSSSSNSVGIEDNLGAVKRGVGPHHLEVKFCTS